MMMTRLWWFRVQMIWQQQRACHEFEIVPRRNHLHRPIVLWWELVPWSLARIRMLGCSSVGAGRCVGRAAAVLVGRGTSLEVGSVDFVAVEEG